MHTPAMASKTGTIMLGITGVLLSFLVSFELSKHIVIRKETEYHQLWVSWIDGLIDRKQAQLNGTAQNSPRFRSRDCPIFLVSSRCFATLDKLGPEKRHLIMDASDSFFFEKLLKQRDMYVLDFLANTLPDY